MIDKTSAVEDVLPVRCLPYCDGMEVPQGLQAAIVQPAHPIFAGIEGPWPPILGMNKLDFRSDGLSQLFATCHHRGMDRPLFAVRSYGRGRTGARRPTSARTGFRTIFSVSPSTGN